MKDDEPPDVTRLVTVSPRSWIEQHLNGAYFINKQVG